MQGCVLAGEELTLVLPYVCACMHACVCACTGLLVQVYAHSCTRIHMCVCACVGRGVDISVHACVCMY